MLRFNGAWRFDSPGAISNGVVNAFFDLIGRIAAQGDRQTILEHFKGYFANASGSAASWSSSASWAETDLQRYMSDAAENAPLFIESFYDACEALRDNHPEFAAPDVSRMNRILAENGAGYEIRPPDLVSRNREEPIVIQQRVASLDEQAQEIIQQSLKQSELLLGGRTKSSGGSGDSVATRNRLYGLSGRGHRVRLCAGKVLQQDRAGLAHSQPRHNA